MSIAATMLGGTSVVSAAEKPNFIVILADDQGYQDLGCYGSPDIKTPNIDRMAADGMRFTDFYDAACVCSPSRAALLTGSYPEKIGVNHVFFPFQKDKGLDPKYVTIPEVLKSAGYATMAVGKWHLGDSPRFLPTNQGFDHYYGVPYSHDMGPSRYIPYAKDCVFREGLTEEEVNKRLKKDNKYGGLHGKVPWLRDNEIVDFPVDLTTLTKRSTDRALEFINKETEQKTPFFLYLAYNMPHTPLAASIDFKGKSARGHYGDAVEEIDYNVGRLLKHLQELNIDKNTLIVYTSDNGPWLTKGKNGGCALPLFEGKTTTFDGGQRVPGIMYWPGHIKPHSICRKVVSTIDLMPTFAKLAGIEIPDTPQKIYGADISNIILARKDAASPHNYFFYAKYQAVRSGDWKYHASRHYSLKQNRTKFKDQQGPALYNLKDDIGESKNLIDKYPEIAERLKKALDNFRKERTE